MTTAKDNFSIFWYFASAPLNVLLTKYIGFSSPLVSCTTAELRALSETTKYKYNGLPFWGRVSIGGDAKKLLSFRKASSH
jgi:hypothetical protein